MLILDCIVVTSVFFLSPMDVIPQPLKAADRRKKIGFAFFSFLSTSANAASEWRKL